MAHFGAGQLVERVAWDKRGVVADDIGNSEGDFAEEFSCRAGFIPLRGGEAVMASRLQGQQPIVVRVRAENRTRAITTDWRMRDMRNGQWRGDPGALWWDGPIYAVRSVTLSANRLWLDIMVLSGVPA